MEVLDMWHEVLIRSGQFLIEPTNVELDQDKFVVVVKDALRLYNKYCPKLEKFNLTIVGPGTGGVYTFTDTFMPIGGTRVLGIPKMISDAIPLSINGVVPIGIRHLFGGLSQNSDGSSSSILDGSLTKCPFPVEYRSPNFYVPLQGDYDIEAYYKHELTSYTDSEGNKQYKVDTLDETDGDFLYFFDYLTGKFMQGIGRSRRAFTIADLPIQVDAAELVSEGERKEEDARTRIIDDDHDFTAAW